MIFKVIHLLQAFSNVIFRTAVKQLIRLQPTQRVARSLAMAELLVISPSTCLIGNGGLHLRVRALVEYHAREQIVDERHEERFVFVDELGQVHVTKHSHHDRRLAVFGVRSLRSAERPQNRQDVAQSEIIVDLHSVSVSSFFDPRYQNHPEGRQELSYAKTKLEWLLFFFLDKAVT